MKALPIERHAEGRPEIHYSRIYVRFRPWKKDGCFDAVFTGSVWELHHADLLDTTVIHGDGTTTAAKKGAENAQLSRARSMIKSPTLCNCANNNNTNASIPCALVPIANPGPYQVRKPVSSSCGKLTSMAH